MLALTTVLRCPVFSIYPEANPGLRPIFHWKIPSQMAEEPTFVQIQVMWSRDGNLDTRPNAVFQPHVPILVLTKADVSAKKFKIKTFSPLRKSLVKGTFHLFYNYSAECDIGVK